MSVDTAEHTLTASDRCDRCGAQAYYQTDMANGYSLLWCNHDYQKNKNALEQTALLVVDESHRL